MTTFDNIFLNSLKMNGLEQFSEHSETFRKLFISLTETNKLYNLTAVTDETAVTIMIFPF